LRRSFSFRLRQRIAITLLELCFPTIARHPTSSNPSAIQGHRQFGRSLAAKSDRAIGRGSEREELVFSSGTATHCADRRDPRIDPYVLPIVCPTAEIGSECPRRSQRAISVASPINASEWAKPPKKNSLQGHLRPSSRS
jgi:hypothetical protein